MENTTRETLVANIKKMQATHDAASTPDNLKAIIKTALTKATAQLDELDKVEKQVKDAEQEQKDAQAQATIARAKAAMQKKKAKTPQAKKTIDKKVNDVVEKAKAAMAKTKTAKTKQIDVKKSAAKTAKSLKSLVATKPKLAMYKGESETQLKRDAGRAAKAPGKRTSADGKTYYEHRANRVDVTHKKYPLLEKGGEVIKGEVKKRTFEALKHPVGGAKRQKLNDNSLTSEYMHSLKYTGYVYIPETETHGAYVLQRSFRTKSEAEAYVDSKTNSFESGGEIKRVNHYAGHKVYFGFFRNRFVVVVAPDSKNAPNELWANEYFKTIEKAKEFAKENEFVVISDTVVKYDKKTMGETSDGKPIFTPPADINEKGGEMKKFKGLNKSELKNLIDDYSYFFSTDLEKVQYRIENNPVKQSEYIQFLIQKLKDNIKTYNIPNIKADNERILKVWNGIAKKYELSTFESGGTVDNITYLDISSDNPLSNQLSKLTGDGWSVQNYEPVDGPVLTTTKPFRHKKSGQVFAVNPKMAKGGKTGEQIWLSVDGSDPVGWDEFYEMNKEGLSKEELNKVKALAIGETYDDHMHATVTRVAAPKAASDDEIWLSVDGSEPIGWDEFYQEVVKDPDADPLSQEQLNSIKALKVGEIYDMGGAGDIAIKRVEPLTRAFAQGGNVTDLTYEDGSPVAYHIEGSDGKYYIINEHGRIAPTHSVFYWTGGHHNNFKTPEAAHAALKTMLVNMHKERPEHNPAPAFYKHEKGALKKLGSLFFEEGGNVGNERIVKERLCICNNCGTVYVDTNPGDQPEIEVIDGEYDLLPNIKDEETGEEIKGCSKCNTDAYLDDVRSYKELIGKKSKYAAGGDVRTRVEQYVNEQMAGDISVIFDKIGMDMPTELEGDEYEQKIDEARTEAEKYFMQHPEEMNDKNYAFGGQVKKGQKMFYSQDNIGKAKYTVSTYNGKDTHKDGSPFYGIDIFHNKKDRDKYIQDLYKEGYIDRPFGYEDGGKVVSSEKESNELFSFGQLKDSFYFQKKFMEGEKMSSWMKPMIKYYDYVVKLLHAERNKPEPDSKKLDFLKEQMLLLRPSCSNFNREIVTRDYEAGGQVSGLDITEDLKNFDLDDLDPLEEMMYKDFVKHSTKEQALQILINSVEGDYTQLSPQLAELAEKQDPQEYANGGKFKAGGTFSDLKRKLQKGQAIKMVNFFGQTDPNDPNDRAKGRLGKVRFVVKVQTNGVYFSLNKEATDGSYFEFPPASLVEVTEKGFKTFEPAARPLNDEEKKVIDGEPKDARQDAIDIQSDGSTMYYRRKHYYEYEHPKFAYLFNPGFQGALRYDSNQEMVYDKAVKGKIAFEYEFVDDGTFAEGGQVNPKVYKQGEMVDYNGRKTKILDAYTDKAFGDRLVYKVKVPMYSNIAKSPLTSSIITVDENTGQLRKIQRSDYVMAEGGDVTTKQKTIMLVNPHPDMQIQNKFPAGRYIFIKEYDNGILIKNKAGSQIKLAKNRFDLNSISDSIDVMADGGELGKNMYKAFYKGKQMDLAADSMYQAQTRAAGLFHAKKSWDVAVVLLSVDGKEVVHSTSEFADGGVVVNEEANKLKADDWFWNYAYRHYMRPATLEQRKEVYCQFVKNGLETDGESGKHAFIVVSVTKPEELKLFKKNGENSIKYAEGGSVDRPFDYMMLNRLQSDCDYYLGYGNRSERVLPSSNVDEHIEHMKAIWNKLTVKPEWLSMADIEEYEKKMKNQYAKGGEVKNKLVWVPGIFTIDDVKKYPGYHVVGEYWNGWETPVFEKEVALKILSDLKMPHEWRGDKLYAQLDYDGGGDESKEEFEECGPGKIVVDGKEIETYGIGAYSWIWSEVDQEDSGQETASEMLEKAQKFLKEKGFNVIKTEPQKDGSIRLYLTDDLFVEISDSAYLWIAEPDKNGLHSYIDCGTSLIKVETKLKKLLPKKILKKGKTNLSISALSKEYDAWKEGKMDKYYGTQASVKEFLQNNHEDHMNLLKPLLASVSMMKSKKKKSKK